MLLTVDIGNTQTEAGVFDGDRLVDHWRIATSRNATRDELSIQLAVMFDIARIDRASIDQVVLSSVVPQLTGAWRRSVRKLFDLDGLFIGPGVRTGISIRTDNPHEVGADRVVNAVAAFERFGQACIVVDMGTATTYDAIGRDGAYLGGAIAPGLGISVDALVQRAARLAQVDLEVPDKAIGTNTTTSVQSGVLLGTIAQVDGMVRRFRDELRAAGESDGDAPSIATGGLSQRIAAHATQVDEVDPLLMLHGLRTIALRHGDGR